VKKTVGSRRRMALLVAAFLITAIILGALMLRKYRLSRLKSAPPPQTEQTGSRLVTLFFAFPDGTGLVRETREIDACPDPAECAGEVIGELINGPVGDLSPTLPSRAALISVRMDGETALVDFAKEFPEGLAGGSYSEMMAVYSIVDSLAFNFPRIKAVKFLLGGQSMESLGHLDLRTPVPPDFTLEKK
jgi:Sporulation and spore germination